MKRSALALAAAGLMAACASQPEIAVVPDNANPSFGKPPVPLNNDTGLGNTPVTAFPAPPPVPVAGDEQPAAGVTTSPVADRRPGQITVTTCTAAEAAPVVRTKPPVRPKAVVRRACSVQK